MVVVLESAKSPLFYNESPFPDAKMSKWSHFKALSKCDHTSAIADHMKTTGHNIKWNHFDILDDIANFLESVKQEDH